MERERVSTQPEIVVEETVLSHLSKLKDVGAFQVIHTSGLPLAGGTRDDSYYLIAPRGELSHEDYVQTINSSIEVQGLDPKDIRRYGEGKEDLISGVAQSTYINEENKHKTTIVVFANEEHLNLVAERSLLVFLANQGDPEGEIQRSYLAEIAQIDEKLSQIHF